MDFYNLRLVLIFKKTVMSCVGFCLARIGKKRIGFSWGCSFCGRYGVLPLSKGEGKGRDMEICNCNVYDD